MNQKILYAFVDVDYTKRASAEVIKKAIGERLDQLDMRTGKTLINLK